MKHVRVIAGKVISQHDGTFSKESVPDNGEYIDITDTDDGQPYVGRTYDGRSFSAPIPEPVLPPDTSIPDSFAKTDEGKLLLAIARKLGIKVEKRP